MEENIQGHIVQKEPIESEKCLTASDYNCKSFTKSICRNKNLTKSLTYQVYIK